MTKNNIRIIWKTGLSLLMAAALTLSSAACGKSTARPESTTGSRTPEAAT